MESSIKEIRNELKQNSDQYIKTTGQNIFKEKVKMHGVKVALVTKIAKSHDKEVLALDKKEVSALSEELWQSGYVEEPFVASHFSHILRKIFEPADFRVFEKCSLSYKLSLPQPRTTCC